jgi:formylglycine-generating enzyme required for sulfatase activity
MFLFCAVADTRPQSALDALHDVLLPALDLEALRQDPNPVLLLLDCLEIAHARRWTIKAFTEPLWAVCEQSLGSDLPPQTRNLLWLAAGKLGIDRRPGIGLDGNGLPEFAWCPVPAGRVTLEDAAGQFDVPAFSMARYPITNSQFQAFIDAEDGYGKLDWWQPEWLEAGWVDPETPRPSHWTEPNAPRESVTWHQAVAFCRWLDHRWREQGRLDAGQQIRLPTEWEWQQAATEGDPDRTYPWGPDWQPQRLNVERSIGRTTVAGLYPNGQSPCGALDMSGNVWEWCLNKYEKVEEVDIGGGDVRVLRGGSWFNSQDYCRAAYRYRYYPNHRDYHLGFRLCLSSPIVDD